MITNYHSTKVYTNQYVNTQNHGGYIKIPFQNPKGITEPELMTYPLFQKYRTTNLYIFKKSMDVYSTPTQSIHSVFSVSAPLKNTVDYDAELVIEHESITNNSGVPVFVCFLLKQSQCYPTTIDQIISERKPFVEIDLDKYIVGNTCQQNNAGTVFVFTTPIPVTSDFRLFTVSNGILVGQGFDSSTAKVCNVTKFESAVEHLESGDHHVIEGFDITTTPPPTLKPGYSLKCRPASISNPKTEAVLLNDNYMYKMDESRTLFTVSSWVSIIFIIVFLCVVVPGIYSMSTDEKSLDYKFVFLFIITFVSSLFMFANKQAMFVGLIGLVISIVSFGIWLSYRKFLSPTKLNLNVGVLTDIFKSMFNIDFLSSSAPVRVPMVLGLIFTVICIILYSTIRKQLSKSTASIGFILFGMIAGIIFYSLVAVFSMIKQFGLGNVLARIPGQVAASAASGSTGSTRSFGLLLVGCLGLISIIMSSIALSKKKPKKPKKPKKLSKKNTIITSVIVSVVGFGLLVGGGYYISKTLGRNNTVTI